MSVKRHIKTGSTPDTPQQTKFSDVGRAAEAKRLQGLVEQPYRNQVIDFAGGQVARPPLVERSCLWIRLLEP